MLEPERLLDEVRDRDTFVPFVRALATERARAAELEVSEPVRYGLGGALGWQNGDIANYLFACLAYFDGPAVRDSDATPGWRMMADILFCGKIIE